MQRPNTQHSHRAPGAARTWCVPCTRDEAWAAFITVQLCLTWLAVVVQGLARDAKLGLVRLLLALGLVWPLIHGSRVQVAPPVGTACRDGMRRPCEWTFGHMACEKGSIATMPQMDASDLIYIRQNTNKSLLSIMPFAHSLRAVLAHQTLQQCGSSQAHTSTHARACSATHHW